MKTYQALVAALHDEGLDTMFGIMGDANMHYIAHYVDALGGRYLGTAHEATAMSMTDGFWRGSGRLAIASVTHGPGFTNVMTPLTEAVRNGSPAIVVTGDTPRDRTYGQNIDIPAVVAPTGAGYEPIYRSDTVVFDARRAVHRARVEQRPIVMNLPSDVMNGDTDEIITGGPTTVAPPTLIADEDAIDRALGLIASARRPLVLAGHGAALAGARAELEALAELLGAPVATTLMGLGFFRGHPWDLGVCGSLSSATAIEVIAESDCIVAFGASLNRFTAAEGDLFRGKRIVQCVLDAGPVGLYTRPDEVVLGDARATAQRFVDALHEAGPANTGWAARNADRIAAADVSREHRDRSSEATVDPRTAIARIDQLLPPNRRYVSDLGRFFTVWKYLHGHEPSSFTHTAHFGSIGLGLGTAMGVALGGNRPTVLLAGDGGFMQYAAELATAARYRIPLLVLLLNDSAYGMEYRKLTDFGDDPRHCLTEWPDFATFARAVGAEAFTVRDLADLTEVGKTATDLTGPYLIDIRLDPTIDTLGS
jgi:thiamine pyrophosphate-dependent acetolactate synthase large subunit-like protein